jgi:hypothetical protein
VLDDLSLAIQMATWSGLIAGVVLTLLGVLYLEGFSDWLRYRHPRLARFFFELYRSLIVTGVTVFVGYFTLPWGFFQGETRCVRAFAPTPLRNFLWVTVRALAAPVALVVTTYAVWETKEDTLEMFSRL